MSLSVTQAVNSAPAVTAKWQGLKYLVTIYYHQLTYYNLYWIIFVNVSSAGAHFNHLNGQAIIPAQLQERVWTLQILPIASIETKRS